MNKLLLLSLLAPLHLIGCAAEEDNNPDWKAGLYTGSITLQGAKEGSFLLITSDQRAFFAEDDGENVGLGTVSGSVVNFGDQASMTQTDESFGTFNFGGLTGTFNLSQSSLYDTSPSLDTLAGTYDDSIDLAGINATWVFSAGGTFDFTGSLGCSGNGYIIPIDSTKNEYQVVMSINVTCNGHEPDTTYTGLAFTDTADDTIYLLVQNAAFTDLIFSKMIR